MANAGTNRPEGDMSGKEHRIAPWAKRKVTLPGRFRVGTCVVRRSVTRYLHNRSKAHEQRDSGAVKTMPKRNGESADDEVVVDAAPAAPDHDRTHVRLVAGDPPMLRLEI